MNKGLAAFQRTHTWDLVPMQPGTNTISCKWTYKIKIKSDGFIERYKTRLIARGFTQEHGIDYEETFALVTKMTSIRALIALAVARRRLLYQMDAKNASLNGDLSEVVYIQPPPGISSSPSEQVCRLRELFMV